MLAVPLRYQHVTALSVATARCAATHASRVASSSVSAMASDVRRGKRSSCFPCITITSPILF